MGNILGGSHKFEDDKKPNRVFVCYVRSPDETDFYETFPRNNYNLCLAKR